jgi:transaldolase
MNRESLLARLAAVSDIVPEASEAGVAARFGARHVNLSAARITAAAQLPEHADLVDGAVRWAQRTSGRGQNRKLVAIRAVERLPIEFARRLLERLPGRVSVELDGRLAYKRRNLVDRARATVEELEEAGGDRDRVLCKLPATWEGIEAARELEKLDIDCHMTLVLSESQLAACADAGARVVSPPVGRITDFHRQALGVEGFAPDDDPGVRAAGAMWAYLKGHGYATELMPATFRDADQALALAGCELLCLPVALLEILDDRTGEVARRLDPARPPAAPEKRAVDAARFAADLAADTLAQQKLQAGVKNLSWAFVSQENQLADWITSRQDEAAESSTAALFRIWDYDGDGYIDREEWNGSEEVFNALDRDKNGRISLEEMALGLGAPHKP